MGGACVVVCSLFVAVIGACCSIVSYRSVTVSYEFCPCPCPVVSSPPMSQCPSCGSSLTLAAPSSSLVMYKTIISHYNQVLRMLGLTPHTIEPAATVVKPGSAGIEYDRTSPVGDYDYDGQESPLAVGRKGRRTARTIATMPNAVPRASVPDVSVWPKERAALSAAGGVGLLAVFHELKVPAPYHPGPGVAKENPLVPPPDDPDSVPSRLVVSEIPPIIHALQPALSVEDYRRLKRDPGFQAKQVKTCEGCFLVYAQVTAMT